MSVAKQASITRDMHLTPIPGMDSIPQSHLTGNPPRGSLTAKPEFVFICQTHKVRCAQIEQVVTTFLTGQLPSYQSLGWFRRDAQ